MGVNKVIYGGNTLIDISDKTVTPETLFEGETAKNAAGEDITGTFTLASEMTEQDSLIEQIKTALKGKAAGGGTPSAESVLFVLGDGTQIALASVGRITITDGEVFEVKQGNELLWERPAPYKTELLYLETTGTQYIDMGVSAPLTVEAKIQGLEAKSRSSIVLSMGAGTGAGDWFGFTSVWTLGGSVNFDNAYNEMITANCTFTGSELTVTIGDTVKTRSGSTSGTLCIGSSASSYPANCRIFSVKIYNDSGVLVGDLIPVLDWNDRPCMYDKVTGELFYNQGTGEFIYA